MIVGRVREIWRYPVKSMQGERLDAATVGESGISGDRGWALRDETAGEIRGAKKLPALMRCSARYLAEPVGDTIPAAEITLPDGARVRADAADAGERLSALLGRRVTIWPRRSADDREHYRRAAPDNPDMMAELREVFGRTPDEPLPDLSVFSPEILEFTSPLGTYFDASPLHLLTTASLGALSAKTPGARFDVRRFRPNLLIEPSDDVPGLVEQQWCGKTLRIGAAAVRVDIPCPRCVMTTLEQPGLPKDPTVLRTIVRDAAQNLGVYATPIAPGRVAPGDVVELI
jgi:uncharacterized protein YcbX